MNATIVLGVAGVFGVLVVTLVLALALKPGWFRDKPYRDGRGVLVPCGCRGCGR